MNQLKLIQATLIEYKFENKNDKLCLMTNFKELNNRSR